MKNIEDTENIGKLPATVIRVGPGVLTVEYRSAEGAMTDTWNIEDPEQIWLTSGGALVYVDNHGEVTEIIGAAALIRVERKS
jgi:hypothetical protein